MDIRCENYRTLRLYLGLNKAEFARSILKSNPYSSLVESGQLTPTDRAVEIICERHHINKDWFVGLGGAMFLPGEERAPFDYNTLGNRIRSARMETDVTIKAFAKALEVSYHYMSAVERGKVKPSNTLVRRMADKLDVSYKWLSTGEGEMRVDPDPELTEIIRVLKEDPALRNKVLKMMGKQRQTQ